MALSSNIFAKAWNFSFTQSRSLSIRPFLRHTGCPLTFQSSRRCMATALATDKPTQPDPTTPPLPKSKGTIMDPRISGIVDEISGLTLLQAADLVAALKARLNIQEIAAPLTAPAAATTPVEAEEPPAQEKPKEKTIFSLKLESIEATAKPKIIREVKAIIPNLNLIDAKKFVESIPKTLKENMPKEEAEKLKATLEGLGAKVTLE